MAAERTEEKSSQSGERAVASVLIALLVVMLYGSYREVTVRYALDEAYLIKTRNAVYGDGSRDKGKLRREDKGFV